MLLDFRLWIYTALNVQKEVIQLIATYASKRSMWFRNEIGIQRILDICRSYYWFTAEEHSLAVENTVTDPESGYVVGMRPAAKQIRELRRALLDIVFSFTKELISFEETKGIVSYLLHCKDNRQIVDLLQVGVVRCFATNFLAAVLVFRARSQTSSSETFD